MVRATTALRSSSQFRVARFRNWRAHPCVSHAGAVTSIQSSYRGWAVRVGPGVRRPRDSAAARAAIDASFREADRVVHEQLVHHAAATIQTTCRENVKRRYRDAIVDPDRSSRRQAAVEAASKVASKEDDYDGGERAGDAGALHAVRARRAAQPHRRRVVRESPVRIAARLVQRLVRRRRDAAIFRHYKSLIDFHDAGDPAAMLRSINPGEASMMDAASGAFVRFRLGGRSFPPGIYYKIFTRTAICDMGAFAPRNYAAVPSGGDEAGTLHARGDAEDQAFIRIGRTEFKASIGAEEAKSKEGWYMRRENNGWRPVAPRLLQDAKEDPVTVDTGAKVINYHHDRIKRQSDRAAARDTKRREWMLRMYREGKAKEEDEARKDRIAGEWTMTGKSVSAEEPEVEDLDEMLQWADELDFDSYSSAWSTIGTSHAAHCGK